MKRRSRNSLFSLIASAAATFISLATLAAATVCLMTPRQAQAQPSGIRRFDYRQGHLRLAVEILNDQVMHFEFSDQGSKSALRQPTDAIDLSPYIDRVNFGRNFDGPNEFKRSDDLRFETSALRVEVNPESLCIRAHDKRLDRLLTQVCPTAVDENENGLLLERGEITDLYGLGEQFLQSRAGSADGDWMGETRSPGNQHGNFMTSFKGGFTGNAQFPILYALGPGKLNYAIFLDSVQRQTWNFQNDPWRVSANGSGVRFFLIAGRDLPELRQTYLKLVGRPLVPPKKAFGLWVSEYGFDNWDELLDKLRTLRSHHFPIDGFVLDLQWFGGIGKGDDTSMGRLRFDESHFPDPRGMIQMLQAKEGIGLMTIEESYIGRNLPEHGEMEKRGFLARESIDSTKAFFVNNPMPWWGRGGMIDWSHPEAGRFWHDWKRKPLIDLGIVGHWTDLGEPEMYEDKDRPGALPFYHGDLSSGQHAHADIHNVYSLFWHESIFKGYRAHSTVQRPWILSRSGGSGSQRFGVGMWSGDIGSNFASLATHLNTQLHMSFSGVDYFGADIGGFHRSGLQQEPGTKLDELYTQWFANGAAFDVPVRPHTENVANTRETAPDRLGDLRSNLANIRLRYELSPYLYSLAHRAHLYGEPVFPPLVFYYQDESNRDRSNSPIRKMGHEKLIGRDLLVGVVARAGETSRDIFLPAGEWIDYHTHRRYESFGDWIRNYPEIVDGVFRLPLLARAGAIIPTMHVDEQTMNIEGKRYDGTTRDELSVTIFSGKLNQWHSFTLYEDDGRTNDYLSGRISKTVIKQINRGSRIEVRIEPTQGSYVGAPSRRATVIHVVLPKGTDARVAAVKLGGMQLRNSNHARSSAPTLSDWSFDTETATLTIKSDRLPVDRAKKFEIILDVSSPAERK